MRFRELGDEIYAARFLKLARARETMERMRRSIYEGTGLLLRAPAIREAFDLAYMELVGNVMRHADWAHERSPTLEVRCWEQPRIQLTTTNMTSGENRSEFQTVMAILSSPEAVRKAYADRIQDRLSTEVPPKSFGLGLLRIPCEVYSGVSGEISSSGLVTVNAIVGAEEMITRAKEANAAKESVAAS